MLRSDTYSRLVTTTEPSRTKTSQSVMSHQMGFAMPAKTSHMVLPDAE